MRDELLERVRALAGRDERVLIGITGCPGAGKSTVAAWLARTLDPEGRAAVWVPMDGFHLAQRELRRLGGEGRKGAIDTFDGAGYVELMRRLARDREWTVYAPMFNRAIEEPIAGAIPVFPETGVVVTEGNYLLDKDAPWNSLGSILSEVWYCELEEAVRMERLVARHVQFGRSEAEAEAWVASVDEPNAERIRRTQDRADLVIDPDTLGIAPA